MLMRLADANLGRANFQTSEFKSVTKETEQQKMDDVFLWKTK